LKNIIIIIIILLVTHLMMILLGSHGSGLIWLRVRVLCSGGGLAETLWRQGDCGSRLGGWAPWCTMMTIGAPVNLEVNQPFNGLVCWGKS
jgi:hypothetical protein